MLEYKIYEIWIDMLSFYKKVRLDEDAETSKKKQLCFKFKLFITRTRFLNYVDYQRELLIIYV